MDLRDVLGPVLEAVARHMGLVRGTITLLNRDTGEISIEAAYGLSAGQRQRGRYKLGEGITGKVVATGQPAIVPRVAEEPQFLDRTGISKRQRNKDISFFCVPIKLENETVGALSATRLFAEGAALDDDVRLMRIVASMISQAVRLRRAAHEERERLLEESARLRQELKERFRPSNIIGRSKAMQAVYDLIAQVAKGDTTVLLRGESGVGKELVAHAIHYN
ncbi:MAG: GAF domain-containing protein, partial [Planctomycetes bacterium]|nr:GAF domain-containing protein [Planctomycetota bacterium]